MRSCVRLPVIRCQWPLQTADRVIVLGEEAQLPQVDGVTVERWITDEPSERGIDGRERMDLVRDDIATRVQALTDALTRL